MSNYNKKLEDMSIEELQQELKKVYKKTNFKVKKAKAKEDGTIILDPKNKNDREWFENDKDYDVL